MNTLILYYSNLGNNRYIAQKLSADLNGEIEEIVPKKKSLFSLLFATVFKCTIRMNNTTHQIQDFENILLCGPIWMGHLAAPVYSMLKKNRDTFRNVYIVTCCGSTENDKDTKFGYQSLFNNLRKYAGAKLKKTYALSTAALIEESKRTEANITELKIDDSNFERIKDQYEKVVEDLKKEVNCLK